MTCTSSSRDGFPSICFTCSGSCMLALCIKAGLFRRDLRRRGAVLSKMFQVVLNLDAHHQVRAAFQIEAETNILSERRFNAGPGEIIETRPAPVWSNNNVKTDEGYE